MSSELAALSRSIDPLVLGTRLKHARLAAGLTQTELAAGEVSTAYISRIEAGDRRPEHKLLERMAARAGTTVAQLVGAPEVSPDNAVLVDLDYAELSLRTGDPKAAVEYAANVLAADPDRATDEWRRRARLAMASAHERLGDLESAIGELEVLADGPERDEVWIRGLKVLSYCYREIGDLDAAVAVGQRAERDLEGIDLADLTETMQLTIAVASALAVRGDLHAALRMCERALADADRVKSPIGRASAYWETSYVHSKLGHTTEALRYAERALGIFEAADDLINVASLRTQYAILMLRDEPVDVAAAIATLETAEREVAMVAAGPSVEAHLQVAMARARLLQGELVEAQAAITQAMELAKVDAPLVLADAWSVQGRILFEQGDRGAAVAAYQHAVESMSGVGADRDAGQVWAELGGLFEQVDDAAGAMDCYKRAAASTGIRLSTESAAKMASPTAG